MTFQLLRMLLIATALSTTIAAPSHAQSSKTSSPVQVVKIRVAQLTLYDKAGNRIGAVSRDEIKLPLPVLEVAPGSGNLKLRLGDGREVWVKSFTVETDKSLSVPESGGSTGSNAPKAGSSRGLGGEPTYNPPDRSSRPVGPPAGTPGAYPPSQERPAR
jgi:hypothetical protein